MSSKNLGQVSGVYIGSDPPENIIMIWYDNTPSQMIHKVYNPGLSQWVVLDQNIISSITYSELVNIARNVGLTIGQWFKITDKSNALALSITSTKVQYLDLLGNILIDDLGTNIQYHVSSSNLSIDDVIGVFDVLNNKLVFEFNESIPDYTANDYVLGKIERNNVWSLSKYRLSSFLSNVIGNSISWNGGFFFNFYSAISGIFDKKGGVVSKDSYDIDQRNIAINIQNVGKENQTIINNANTAIANSTADVVIYNKAAPDITVSGEPIDAMRGDTLITIISKFQRYINKFKFATGINISTNFADRQTPEFINNNDTVDSAFSKVQYWLKKIYGTLSLSSTFVPQKDPSYEVPIPACAPNDSIETAIAKLQGIINDIGIIADGYIRSNRKVYDANGVERGSAIEFDMQYGDIEIRGDQASRGGGPAADISLFANTTNNISIVATDYNNPQSAKIGLDGVYANGVGQKISNINGQASAVFSASGNWGNNYTSNLGHVWYAGLYASSINNFSGNFPSCDFGAYIEKLFVSGLVLSTKILYDTDNGIVLSNLSCYFSLYNTLIINIYLPAKPQIGQTVWIRQRSTGYTLNGNGNVIIENDNNNNNLLVNVSENGSLYFILFDGQYWMMNH